MRLYDCFLYNDEIELLESRLDYLADTVDRVVIVVAGQTFTGKPKAILVPESHSAIARHRDRIDWIRLEQLPGCTAWDRESYSRNAITAGLTSCEADDLVLISDVDEIPRKSALQKLKASGCSSGPRVLALDYFNFRFNFHLVHGVQAVWAGPLICTFRAFRSAQRLRDSRWSMLDQGRGIDRAGWHFSFLSATSEVRAKLRSFSHQEPHIRSRRFVSIDDLIRRRQGFHDHIHAGAVWAVVAPTSYGCNDLPAAIGHHKKLFVQEPPDPGAEIEARIRGSLRQVYDRERTKVLMACSSREVAADIWRRAKARLGSVAS